MNIANLLIGKLNLCYVAYIYDGKRERERNTGRERSLQDHVIHNKMRIASCVYPTNFPCVAPALSVFHGNLPLEICGTVTRQCSKVTRPSADCQAHICMNKRVRERERVSPLHFTRAPPCCAVGRFISRRPRWSWLLPVWKRRPLTRVGDRQGQLVYEYCKSSHWQVEFMLCDLFL